MADLQDIVRRKQRLIVRCGHQRQEIAATLVELRQPIALADRVLEGVAYLRAHPILLAVGVAVAAALRPRSLPRLALRAFSAWRAVQAIRQWAGSAGAAWSRGRRAEQT